MAVRADFDLQIVTKRRTRRECVAATTGHCDFLVVGMDAGFHGIVGLLGPEGLRKMGAQCSFTHHQLQDDGSNCLRGRSRRKVQKRLSTNFVDNSVDLLLRGRIMRLGHR